MNKAQEIGAALVLMLGGDSPSAIRAGDALLADRIDEAVEEGGFEVIEYEGWRKADGRASTLEFEGIRLARGPAEVSVDRARMHVFSKALEFHGGAFEWTGDARSWNFDVVQIEPMSFFGSSLRVSAQALRLQDSGGDAGAACEATTAGGCDLQDLEAGQIDRFSMEFRPRSREAVVSIAWRSASRCRVAWTADGRGAEDLAHWGASFLAAPDGVGFDFADLACDSLSDRDLPKLIDRATDARSRPGGQVYGATPALMMTLFGLVAQSYAYLLE